MESAEKVKLARWFNARGVRMMKCAGHVESCSHYKAFKELADAKFAERDRLMGLVRVETGKRKQFLWEITDGLDVLAIGVAFDELGAAAQFEEQCENQGLPVFVCAVRKKCRWLGRKLIAGKLL